MEVGQAKKKTGIFKNLMHNLCAGLFLQAVVIAKEMGRHQQKSNESGALINLKISPRERSPMNSIVPPSTTMGRCGYLKASQNCEEKKPICPSDEVTVNVSVLSSISNLQGGDGAF